MSEQILLEDAKWSCRSCGKCCEGFSFGPVEPHIIENLTAHHIADLWAPAKNSWYSKDPQTGDFFLRHVDGHCVFLQEDKLCKIHALFGEEAKPWFCREYPFHVVEEPRGLAVRVREDCGGFHKSYLDGEDIAEQTPEILQIIRTVPRQKFKNMNVIILPGVAVSADNWSQVEAVLLKYAKQQKEPQDVVRVIRNKLLLMAGRHEREPQAEQLMITFRSLLQYFLLSLQRLEVAPNIEMKKQQMTSLLQLANNNYKNSLQPIPKEVGGYFNLVLRGRLLGKTFASIGGVPASLGLFLFETMMLRMAADSDDLQVIGTMMSQWRRGLMLQSMWRHVRTLEKSLSNLFWYA